ncbi:ATP-NAD kinase [Clostridium bovifaecis]|uniref:ATP-NAD kinase n=1 Tax=Clostridium bovifaecis TaxID=2184719 RepID=A0A6I6F031_9CLOT|nr:ATP-NAD kinase [Clostridium bovifaecis]
MGAIGIISNPGSGKDIRRLFSSSMNLMNSEKANIVERAILAAYEFGTKKFYIMPDSYRTGERVLKNIKGKKGIEVDLTTLNFRETGQPRDTEKAVEMMNELDISCLVVLGGDGTSRLVAKGNPKMPIIPIATGTNNVYPENLEGTNVGMAAAYIDQKGYSNEIVYKDKRIDIFINGELKEVAVVEAIISSNPLIGSKAIWKTDEILEIVAILCRADTIGFSAIIGVQEKANQSDPFGFAAKVNKGSEKIKLPISAGEIIVINTTKPTKIDLGKSYIYRAEQHGTLALDGERTITYKIGDEIEFKITREGPIHVNVRNTLEKARDEGFFRIKDFE